MRQFFKSWIILEVLFCSFMMNIRQSNAQIIDPFAASYFQAQYLSNPAMAGISGRTLDLNAGYRQEAVSVPDGPTNQYLTGALGITDKMGIGVNIYNEKAGLLRSTQLMGTYAYHVPLNEKNGQLLLGISAGVFNVQVDNSHIIGDNDDPIITEFNGQSYHFDAAFGAAFTNGRLTVQGAFPGIVTHTGKNQTAVIDETRLFSAISYKLTFNGGENTVGLEPKFCYRIINGYNNILDAGANLSFLNNFFNIFGMYHTSKNATMGAGLNIKKTLKVMTTYTTGTSALKGYTNHSFEIGLGLMLGNK